MSSHFRVQSAARSQLRSTSPVSKRWLSVVCWALLVGRECLALPPVPFGGPDPSDPVPVPPASYRSVVAPYTSLRPAKPGNWLQQNQSPAPPSGAPGMHMPGMDMPGMETDGHQGHQH